MYTLKYEQLHDGFLQIRLYIVTLKTESSLCFLNKCKRTKKIIAKKHVLEKFKYVCRKKISQL